MESSYTYSALISYDIEMSIADIDVDRAHQPGTDTRLRASAYSTKTASIKGSDHCGQIDGDGFRLAPIVSVILLIR